VTSYLTIAGLEAPEVLAVLKAAISKALGEQDAVGAMSSKVDTAGPRQPQHVGRTAHHIGGEWYEGTG
jgi:hypothetical protein